MGCQAVCMFPMWQRCCVWCTSERKTTYIKRSEVTMRLEQGHCTCKFLKLVALNFTFSTALQRISRSPRCWDSCCDGELMQLPCCLSYLKWNLKQCGICCNGVDFLSYLSCAYQIQPMQHKIRKWQLRAWNRVKVKVLNAVSTSFRLRYDIIQFTRQIPTWRQRQHVSLHICQTTWSHTQENCNVNSSHCNWKFLAHQWNRLCKTVKHLNWFIQDTS